MDVEDLQALLIERGVLPQDLPSDRGGIVNLYNRLVLPLPQREIIKSSRLSKKLRRHKSPDKGMSNNTYTPVTNSKTSVHVHLEPSRCLKSKSTNNDAHPPAKKSKNVITWP
ncbi:unnamed protein product [Allacma fusca]|uniref:Ashwin n=1 Tax=Allacma fusca TaxID=39272 RepID=A0A8J2P1Q9_9HEXA|nr:unnamed protein product [Allacma fusca]